MRNSLRLHPFDEAVSPERPSHDAEDRLSRRRSVNTELAGVNERRTSNNDNIEVEGGRRLGRTTLFPSNIVNCELDDYNERRNGRTETPANNYERRNSGEIEHHRRNGNGRDTFLRHGMEDTRRVPERKRRPDQCNVRPFDIFEEDVDESSKDDEHFNLPSQPHVYENVRME